MINPEDQYPDHRYAEKYFNHGGEWHETLVDSTGQKKKNLVGKERKPSLGSFRKQSAKLRTERGLFSPQYRPQACAYQAICFYFSSKPDLTSSGAAVVALSADVCSTRAWRWKNAVNSQQLCRLSCGLLIPQLLRLSVFR